MIKKLIASLAVASIVFLGANASAADRPTISKGEYAYIARQVQNTMSKHAFYHAAGMNLEEVDTLWVSRDGEFAQSATFASPAWVMAGVETVRNNYGLQNQGNRENALKQISAMFPEIEFTEANLGAGHEWAMHTNTTPVIEVAGDGKTAKGLWYSPGVGLMTRMSGDTANAGSVFFWEKYGGDFVLEDGKWKIWHLQMAYDFTPGFPSEMTSNLGVSKAGAQGGGQAADAGGPPGGGAGGPPGGGAGGPPGGGAGGPPGGGAGGPPPGGGGDEPMREAGERQDNGMGGMQQPHYSYPSWSPKRPGLIYPRIPEPYYTFSETFSYCNCDESSYPDNSATLGIVKLSDEE